MPGIKDIFTRSLQDSTLFPAKCCGVLLDPDPLSDALTDEILKEYTQKKAEFDDHDKTYCHISPCSTYIPPSKIVAGRARCFKCEAITCASCKKECHGGCCTKNKDEKEILATAAIAGEKSPFHVSESKQEAKKPYQYLGWQRCSSCRSLIELKDGCNHVTVRIPRSILNRFRSTLSMF